MSKRYYGKIETAIDLDKLQQEADKKGKIAVGVTKGGGLYALEKGKAVRIAGDAAAIHLETTVEEIRNLVEKKGNYEIQSKKVEASVGLEEELPDEPVPTPEVIEEVPEEVVTDPEPIEIIEEPEPEEEPVQEETPEPDEAPEYIQKVEKAIAALEAKVDALPGEHDGLLKEVKGLRADVGRFINKLDKILLD